MVTMPLSEYEQRVLDQLERQLVDEDPSLAENLGSTTEPRATRTLVRIGIASLGIIAGLILLVVGVSIPNFIVGVIGFLVMFGTVTYAVMSSSSDKGTKPAKASTEPKKSSKVVDKMDDRWQRRMDERG